MTILRAVAVAAGVAGGVCLGARASASPQVSGTTSAADDRPTLSDAQHAFYNARYAEAAAQALELRAARPEDLAVHELRASALFFQLKSALGGELDKDNGFTRCGGCPDLLAAFSRDTARGQALARARLATNSGDDEALFFLAKLGLTNLWLQLGPLGRKKGWHDYWEARRSLDTLIKRRPQHVRALVARAWIDYIVDTKVPWAARWLLGGGSRKRALAAVRRAASADGDFFARVEAGFALWEMEVREGDLPEAIVVARALRRDFPENPELASFLAAHDP